MVSAEALESVQRSLCNSHLIDLLTVQRTTTLQAQALARSHGEHLDERLLRDLEAQAAELVRAARIARDRARSIALRAGGEKRGAA